VTRRVNFERDGLELAVPDQVDDVAVDVRDRWVIQVADHHGLRREELVGCLDDGILADGVGVAQIP
jgi:hypothetical protein